MGNVANLRDEVKRLQVENKRLVLENQQLRNVNQTDELSKENQQLKRDIGAFEYLVDARGREIAIKRDLLEAAEARVQSAMLFIISLVKRIPDETVIIPKAELTEAYQNRQDIRIDVHNDSYFISMVQPTEEDGCGDEKGGNENVKECSAKKRRSRKTAVSDETDGKALN